MAQGISYVLNLIHDVKYCDVYVLCQSYIHMKPCRFRKLYVMHTVRYLLVCSMYIRYCELVQLVNIDRLHDCVVLEGNKTFPNI